MRITAKQLSSLANDDVLQICRILQERGYGAWLVGGCLRDFFLSRPITEFDLATVAEPAVVKNLFEDTIDIGERFGSIGLRWGDTIYEVTTLRQEGLYPDSRHPGDVTFTANLRLDLGRRDFTINSLAYDPLKKELFDYYGGLDDLKERILRTVGDPRQRFAEDGLRLLRAVRFYAQLPLTIDPKTQNALLAESSRLVRVSPERITTEFLKLLGAQRASEGLQLLKYSEMLTLISPVLAELGPAHWAELLALLPAVPPLDRLLFIAGFLPKLADIFLENLTLAKKEKAYILTISNYCQLHYTPEMTDSALRFALRACPDIEAVGRLYASLHQVEGARLSQTFARRLVKIAPTIIAKEKLAISGNDIKQLGLAAGPAIGQILNKLWDIVTEYPAKNRWSELIGYARQMVSDYDALKCS